MHIKDCPSTQSEFEYGGELPKSKLLEVQLNLTMNQSIIFAKVMPSTYVHLFM